MGGGAFFIGALVVTLIIVGFIPIAIGGFNPFGKRTTSNRTVLGWMFALLFAMASVNGGTNPVPVALALILVLVAFLINRARPARV